MASLRNQIALGLVLLLAACSGMDAAKASTKAKNAPSPSPSKGKAAPKPSPSPSPSPTKGKSAPKPGPAKGKSAPNSSPSLSPAPACANVTNAETTMGTWIGHCDVFAAVGPTGTYCVPYNAGVLQLPTTYTITPTGVSFVTPGVSKTVGSVTYSWPAVTSTGSIVNTTAFTDHGIPNALCFTGFPANPATGEGYFAKNIVQATCVNDVWSLYVESTNDQPVGLYQNQCLIKSWPDRLYCLPAYFNIICLFSKA